MTIYEEYAPFYDGSGQIRFAILMGQYLAEVLERHPVAGRRALDLACGTGTLALILAERGWQVVGADASAGMLTLARSRAAASDTPERLHFVQADMRNLLISDAGEQHSWWSEAGQPWAGAFDLALCTYDSLNYLLSAEELGACFQQVASVVRPGGLFMADMNTHHFLEHDWGEYEVLEQPGFVQVTQSSFDPANATSTMLLSGFVGDDTHGYRRFDETHIERAYPAGEVADLLRAARFHVEATYECFTFDPLHERAQRVAWVARRRTDDLPAEGE